MATSKTILCGPCYKGKVNIKADIWCYNCNDGLCSTCSGHHRRTKGTREHKILAVKSFEPFISDIKTECDKHGQQLNKYCPSHLMPCCDVCISISHAKCTGIKSLASVVDTTNTEQSKGTIEKEISSILSFLDKLLNNKSKNINTGEHQYISIKKSIGEIRKEINKHLDHMEKKLCQEADTIWNQEKSKATDFISAIEETKNNLKKIKEKLQTVTTKTSKLQSFLGVDQIEKQVHQCQQYVDDLENDERTKKFDIKIKRNDEIEQILCKLVSIKSLGEVMVVKTETDLDRERSVRREAQVELQEHSNIHNITMNIEKEKEINMNILIDDMICLMDGRFIVVERRGNVYILTPDGKLEKQLKQLDGAYGVTQINQYNIAIVCCYEKAVMIFNIKNETITKVLRLHKKCTSLSFSNNSFAMSLDFNEICIIDLKGNRLKSIQVPSESQLINLVHSNDRIIYSDYNGRAVYCYDESGKQIWKYTQDLSGPKGLCTDAYGNIFVADCESDRIIVISKDGQDSKVLISEEDRITSPQFIGFKHRESSGFICYFEGTYLAKFNLS